MLCEKQSKGAPPARAHPDVVTELSDTTAVDALEEIEAGHTSTLSLSSMLCE